MTWYDAEGRGWMNRRLNGWPTDTKAPDGYTVGGFRRIDKSGRIRFGGSYWTHDRLKENIGRTVRVCWGGVPGDFTDERAQVYFGHHDANPNNYLDHHSSFYEWRSSVLCEAVGDWNKRPVTKF